MDTSLITEEWLSSVDEHILFLSDNEWSGYGVYRCVECSPKQSLARFWPETSQHWSAGHGKHIESCRIEGKGGWDKRAETGNTAPKCKAIQRKLRAIEYQKIDLEQREETLKRQVSGLEKGNWNDGMRRECLSFLKLDRSQTCLAFSFLSSRVAPTRQSHFNRDFACRFKGLNKVNYKLHLFPKYYPVK